MEGMLICFAAVLALAAGRVPPPSFYCTAQLEGQMQYGCWGYHLCTGGLIQTVTCQDDEVLERNDQGQLVCVIKSFAAAENPPHSACTKVYNCIGQKDGHWADYEVGCTSFFRCAAGNFLGHFYCPPNTYFNEQTERCDYPNMVDPACFATPHTAPPGR